MVEFPKHAQRQKDMPDEEEEREVEVKGEARDGVKRRRRRRIDPRERIRREK